MTNSTETTPDHQARIIAKALRKKTFATLATVSPKDRSHCAAHHEAGRLNSIAGHGAMEMEGACFLRISPRGTIHSFGAGVPMLDLVRDPLGAGARASFAAAVLAQV